MKNLIKHLAEFQEGSQRENARRQALDLPVNEFIEAFGRDDYDSLMLDVSHLRIAKGYAGVKTCWGDVSNRASASDFKTNYIAAGGSFGDFDEVKELDSYPLDNFTDEQASYSVSKYGKMFGISMEARANDSLGELGRWGQRFGAASARTIEKFVIQTNLRDNPTIYDSNSLFDASNHSNDLGSATGYTRAALIDAIELFMEQTDRDGNPISLMPSTLLVKPGDLVAAMEDVRSASKLAFNQEDDSTTMVGADSAIGSFGLTVKASPFLTTNAFYLAASPSEAEMFEIGFLNGREEAEVLVENAASGFSFEHDAERIKARTIYGGTWVDYRGIVRGGV